MFEAVWTDKFAFLSQPGQADIQKRRPPRALPGWARGGRRFWMSAWPGWLRKANLSVQTASNMTDGTVSSQARGSALALQDQNGKSAASQTIAIPSDIPVVAVEPGQLADLQTGAYVFVVATRDAGRALTAALVLAGKDGLVSRI